MGKRSDFERIPPDFYPTPESAVQPLLPHLGFETRFCEPCAGDGRLIDHLTKWGHHCAAAWDIEPQRADISCVDATDRLIGNIDCFITNPPWSRPILHELIVKLSTQHPTWLLFDADWMHTKQSASFTPWLRKIVSVGRVKWIEESPHTGKDNCCWYLFDANAVAPAQFIGRAA
ncbi:hypothetical protein [Croceicoccus sp. Ery15]|uniref:hypothetical protein n=1 Tax=Croceicoccus sp. Ery15 TaxID=1703338 RepID=UPI001E3F3107|nr:hypothetical protein [Croceicoccus sp. Ery15]